MKKVIMLLAAVAMVLSMCVHVYADGDLKFETDKLADGMVNSEYEQIITGMGGSGEYTYSLDARAYLPPGLSFVDNGDNTAKIYGTPISNAYYPSIYITVKDSNGVSVTQKFSITINVRLINFYISNYEYTYESNTKYMADIECAEEGYTKDKDYTVTYGSDNLNYVTSAGTYSININMPGYKVSSVINKNTSKEYSPDEVTLTVHKSDAAQIQIITGAQNYTYDGESHPLSDDAVKVEPEGLKYTVKYRKQGESSYAEELPKDVGVYSVQVETADANYSTKSAYTTITISNIKANFTIQNNETEYTGSEQTATVTSTVSLDDMEYTVSYVNTATSEETNAPVDAGTYEIKIVITKGNYEAEIPSNNIFTINPKKVNFSLTGETEVEKGTAFSISVAPIKTEGDTWTLENTDYILYISDENGNLYETNSTELLAGTYSPYIQINNSNFICGEISPSTLTVSAVVAQVNFIISAEKNNIEYGETFNLNVTPSVSSVDYSLALVDENGIKHNVTDILSVGTYSAAVEIDGEGYTLGTVTNLTLTVEPKLVLNIGNSPFGMIASDELEAHSEEWKTLAYEYFKTNYSFGPYLPEGVSDTSVYSAAAWNTGTNPDLDETAVFVKKLSDFVDPGVMVYTENKDGTKIYGTVSNTENVSNNQSAIYDVVYNYDNKTVSRKLVVLGSDTADVNNDGYINGIDANLLRQYIAVEPSNQTETLRYYRIYDLNKDGKITSDDVNAIYKRFSTPILPYYPWVY